MDHKSETLPAKHAGGRPPEVTRRDTNDYLRAISEGMTQDQAADIVGFDRRTMEKWVKMHPELRAASSRARAKCVRTQLRSLTEISSIRDVKGLTAAVKAAQFLAAGYDDRFRKGRDGDGAAGGGTTINVITGIAPPSMSGFFAAGGKAQPEAVKTLLKKYGPGILGDIDEATALRIAAESVDEKGNGTQSGDRGGARPERAGTHTPITPDTISEAIEAATEPPVDSSPLDPIPTPAVSQGASQEGS